MVKTSVHDCFRICTRTSLTATRRRDKHGGGGGAAARRRLTVATTSFRARKPDSTGKTCSVPSAISASCREELGLVLRGGSGCTSGRWATGAGLGGRGRLVGQLSCPASDLSRKLVWPYHIKTRVMVSSHSGGHPAINGGSTGEPDWGVRTRL